MNIAAELIATAARPAPAGSRGFYLIDTESENYFTGRAWRLPSELGEDLARLEIGETHWTSETRGFERFA